MPVDLILGNEFLLNNDWKVGYEFRILTIERNCTVTLRGCEKTSDEILDKSVSEKFCCYVKEKKVDLIKDFKIYSNENDYFSFFVAPPASFHIRKDIEKLNL